MPLVQSKRGGFTAAALTFLLIGFSPTVSAADGTWTATSGNWTGAGNWTPGIPGAADTAYFGNNPADVPVSVNVDSPQSINIFNFTNTDNRTYTFSGSDLTFLTATGTTDARILTGASAASAITINNNVVIGSGFEGPDSPARFTIGGTQPSTSNFSTITFNGSILAGSGTGLKSLAVNSAETATIVINGSNSAGFLAFGGAGELIAGSTSALGAGSVQKTTSSMLSLRSDVTVGGGSYSWTTSGNTTSIRISELNASSTDRTLTFNNRTISAGGALQWVDNVNSTGKLILELKYNGGTVQTLPLITNASAIVRFAQTGDTTFGSIISGGGQLEKTVGAGTTTLSGANTYTGNTLISAGTLLLSDTGKLNFLIGDDGVNNQITGTGNLTLNGAFTFDLLGASGDAGDSWSIVDIASLGTVTYGGTFTVEGFTQAGNLWTSGLYQFDQVDGMLSVVPEPSTVLLMLGGTGWLMGLRRRVRQQS